MIDSNKENCLIDVAELFKVFADSTRIKIIYCLLENSLCVNDIAEKLNMSQSAVSHQLRILKTSKLIKGHREGKQVFYSLDDDHVKQIFYAGYDHIVED